MTPPRAVPEPRDGEGLRRLLAIVPAGGTVLQVGPGPEWDTDVLDTLGVTVCGTDSTDDLGGPYDAVLALAVLHQVDRALVPDLLGRVAGALAPGGVLLVSVREGDGERWEDTDSGSPSSTVLWREPDLCDALEDANFSLEWRAWGEDSEDGRWLTFLARG